MLADVSLVWANCRAYNPAGAAALSDCAAAQQSLQERWLLAGLPSERLFDTVDPAEVVSKPAAAQTKVPTPPNP